MEASLLDFQFILIDGRRGVFLGRWGKIALAGFVGGELAIDVQTCGRDDLRVEALARLFQGRKERAGRCESAKDQSYQFLDIYEAVWR